MRNLKNFTNATAKHNRRRTLAIATSALLASVIVLGSAVPANAVIGSPIVASTPAGGTSVLPYQGKAAGSGLWGYAGDIKTRSSGTVFTYGVAISPTDGSVWVTDSAKAAYGNLALLLCTSNGGTVYGQICYAGESRLMHYNTVGSDWSLGQYSTDGAYSTPAAGANAGIGGNYETLASALVSNGTSAGMTNGEFGGVRGVVVDNEGKAWVTDSDSLIGSAIAANTGKTVRIFNADETENAASFGGATTWADRYLPGNLMYPVAIAKLNSGNMIISSTPADLLQEFTPAGVFVRNILLDHAGVPSYAGDSGYRNPNGLAVDPLTGDILVNYVKSGTSPNQQIVERLDATTGALKATIGLGGVLPNNTDGFALAVDPKTGDLYVAMNSGQMYVFDSAGAYKGRFSAFGTGTKDGQVSTSVRGIAFDANGFMYVTIAEGTTNTRVQIFARTPDPVTAPTAVYACVVDGNGDNTGAVDRTSVALSWTGVAAGVTADAQAPVRDYVVEQSVDSGATWAVVSTPTNTQTTQALSGLNAGSTYQFRISAWNEAGNGDTAKTPVADPTCDLPVADPGTLTVSKVVVDGGTAPAASTTYAFALSCTLAGSPVALASTDATFSLADGETHTASVVADADCAVTESTTGSFTTSYADSDGSTDGTVSVASGAQSTVTVTNTYPEPVPGSLTVTKIVTGDPAPAATEFSFALSCTADDGSPVALAAGDAAFTLLAGGSLTVSDIPANAACAVTEDAVANFTTAFADSDGTTDGTVTIAADAASTVTVTNTYTTPPVECVADENAISVVYSTQNNADAPLDGSYTVYDRVDVGRSDMKLVYTIMKPCVTYPVPVLDYSGDWDVSDPAGDTYATFTMAFGAVDQATADNYSVQLAAMNALLANSPECVNRSIDNFDACVRPIIQAWGASVPVGITGTVTASVKAATPGSGVLNFHLEQIDTAAQLSIDGTTPYVVTQPTLTLAGEGEFCSTALPTYTASGNNYTANGAVVTAFALTADPQESTPALKADDATQILVDAAGLSYSVGAQTFASSSAVHDYLVTQAAGDYQVAAHYVAPDAVAAVDPAPVSITVLGASDAACYTATAVEVTPVVLASTGTTGTGTAIAAFLLLMLSGVGFLAVAKRRQRDSRVQ